ncbi:hypothetical protein M9R32_14340 [Paenisporosarcina quisquiliarum]|uniref:Nuclease-related domain-containing protein n=1 Tax=Paenisporosarcina quisquiliarum TaxID=365346 RepID=A0A9X3LHZ5_9BACL|nr:hypothetical protein [Paenisporosarcina quisquiliarum]MCZ8538372.1 hypothetical protein [Paenisporosarcina quisquiliarum]
MVLKSPERYNFYKFENMISKDIQKFLSHIEEILETDGIDNVIGSLKTSGITINLFNDKKRAEKMKLVIDFIFEKVEVEGKLKVINLLKESSYFKNLYDIQGELREEYFKSSGALENNFEVVSYLISLEKFLRELNGKSSTIKNTDEYANRQNIFDSAIESTGMILKNFIFSKRPFKGSSRNISPKVLEVSEKHLIFSSFWNELNDILEYWKYSDVRVSKNDEGKFKFEILDDEFELNNHISNERFLNLREGWQAEEIAKIRSEYFSHREKDIDKMLSQSHSKLNYLFSTLYFGSPLLEEKIHGIEILNWINAYQLLVDESKKFLRNQKKLEALNVEKVCLSKNRFEWRRFFKQHGFSNEESEDIIELFTFKNKSLDLVDCPFIEIDDKLIIIPSLTSQADASRALASNFLNRDINLDFKGRGFEERTKAGLNLNGITNGGLYKRIYGTEYECDIAFLLGDDLYFVECKAHVQPFTTRQHANHLYKLYKETDQANRIADFYQSNLKYVREQLNLQEDFSPRNIYRILLTTSMIGAPLLINGVYIIDESSFTMFIDRIPPSLKYFDNKNGKYVKYSSTNLDAFNGPLTSRKMIDFLNSPPQIKIFRDFYRKIEHSAELWDTYRNTKVNQTMHMGLSLSESDKSLIHKHFGSINLDILNK